MSETVSVSCPTCQTRMKAPAHLAGKPVPCIECKEIVRVPDLAEELPAHTARVRRYPFECPECGTEGRVEEFEGIETLICSDCSAKFKVRFADGKPKVVKNKPNTQGKTKKRSRNPLASTTGFVALVVAIICFIIAVTEYDSAERRDRNNSNSADALNKLSINIAGYTGDYRNVSMQTGAKSDRTGVWVATIAGVMFSVTSLICFTQGGSKRKKG